MAAIPASNINSNNSINYTSSIRIPAWAMARRLRRIQHSSPPAAEKRIVDRIPSSDYSLTLPRLPPTSNGQVILKMNVSGFQAENLHVDVDLHSGRLCISGKGPRMFKRTFPLSTELDVTRLKAALQLDDEGRKFLVLRAPAYGGDDVRSEEMGRVVVHIVDQTSAVQ